MCAGALSQRAVPASLTLMRIGSRAPKPQPRQSQMHCPLEVHATRPGGALQQELCAASTLWGFGFGVQLLVVLFWGPDRRDPVALARREADVDLLRLA